MNRFTLWLRDSSNRLWVKPAVGSLIALAFALLAAIGNHAIPEGTLPFIERETVDSLLSVIASSMLAVSTFSLSIMVAAFASASSGATPRATELVVGDEDTQTAVASFISAFIYAIVAKTALGLGYYGPTGRFILFVSTLLVLLFIVVTLVRWVKTLSQLGRMGNTIEKVETASLQAMRRHRRAPTMGALLAPPDSPPGIAVLADRVGYIRHVDLAALDRLATDVEAALHIRVRPGTLVYPGTALAVCAGADRLDEDAVRNAFVVGAARSFDQDPRFGLIVLSEVAQRALSPAVNDPGTAIAVMNAMARVVMESDAAPEGDPPVFERLSIVALDSDDFIFQGFDPIAHDGAGSVAVQVRMQKTLAAIAGQPGTPWSDAARAQARRALQRALLALALPEDRALVQGTFDRSNRP